MDVHITVFSARFDNRFNFQSRVCIFTRVRIFPLIKPCTRERTSVRIMLWRLLKSNDNWTAVKFCSYQTVRDGAVRGVKSGSGRIEKRGNRIDRDANLFVYVTNYVR